MSADAGTGSRLYRSGRHLAGSRRGRLAAFTWGFAEALVFPVVPDFLVASLALASPGSATALAAAALAGSMAGGLLAFALGGTGIGEGLLAHAPLVTPHMVVAARDWMVTGGPEALLRQPGSGVPFKVFSLQASEAGLPLAGYLFWALVARGARLAAVAATFAAGGILLRRWRRRAFPYVLALQTAGFSIGLARVVAAWS